MKHIIILCLVSFSAFANPLDDLRAQLLETFKDVEITNKAFQVCENWAVQQVDAAATAKVAAKTAELEQAKTAAAAAAAAKIAEAEKEKAEAAAKIQSFDAIKQALADADAEKAKADALAAVAAAEVPEKAKRIAEWEKQKLDLQAKIDAENAEPLRPRSSPKSSSKKAPAKPKKK